MRDQIKSLRDSAEFAEERLVASAQSLLQQLLNDKGINRTDLATRMGVSKARVSQLFSDDQNFTFRLIAKAFHALGENIHLSLESQRVEYKGISHPPGGGITFDDARRETSHGFEWLDDKIASGGQSVSREPNLSFSEVAQLMKEFMDVSSNENSGELKHRLQNRADTVSDWSRSDAKSNVVELLRKAS